MTEDGSPVSTVLQDNRRSAVFSDDREYRYRLKRTWDVSRPAVGFLMLNPSTADETDNDPTVRRCIGYAKDWGYGTLIVGNIFALRSTDPENLYDHPNPVGPDNDEILQLIADEVEQVVAAWGTHGDLQDRGREVAQMLNSDLYALGTTKDDHPVHPLYQPKDAELVRWPQ